MPRSSFAFAVLVVLALLPWLARPVSCASPGNDHATLDIPAPPEPAVIATADWEGLRRDTWYFVGYQAVTVAALSAMPSEQTNFDRSGVSFSKWRDNVTNPVWDRDDHVVNYVLHPYWGAAYYIRARERGLDRWQSLGYSALLSAVYEFGAEAMFEPVSYQDLIVTPLVGWLLGEYVFSPIRESIKAKPGDPDTLDQVALVLTDPLGALNDLTDRIFGVETQVSLAPIGPSGPGATAALADAQGRLPAPHRPGPRAVAWGLHLQVRW
ncbi:DUF3943 domain-containing protein [Variovorax saccharolyticus]|uniref:DUF3943 domain-containing protein n=1 Tax=Variovorax saccharolyticus TaxID=3053516 RepID=UPI002577A669|nr:DUF3943 domain-containing protein [Variovorax sp. J22R187]MDM0017329.1 DUF3943 domain-containing protein [Variovorax sp. J22R187]